MIRIGILSDTHLTQPTELFRRQAATSFAGVDMILHAGDLTDLSILEVFAGTEVHAVCGNMCCGSVRQILPSKKVIQAGAFAIGLIHGLPGPRNFEEQLLREFDDVDCIVYGHTHLPVCHSLGPILIMNPGSFSRTSRFGAAGTFGILEIGDTIRGSIHEVGSTA